MNALDRLAEAMQAFGVPLDPNSIRIQDDGTDVTVSAVGAGAGYGRFRFQFRLRGGGRWRCSCIVGHRHRAHGPWERTPDAAVSALREAVDALGPGIEGADDTHLGLLKVFMGLMVETYQPEPEPEPAP